MHRIRANVPDEAENFLNTIKLFVKSLTYGKVSGKLNLFSTKSFKNVNN